MYIYYYILGNTYYRMTGKEEYKFSEYFYNLGNVYTENLTRGNSFDFMMHYAAPFKLYTVKKFF